MQRRRTRAGRALAAIVLLAAVAGSRAANDDEALGPLLIHYTLQCHDDGRCRIDCFQAGANVVSRLGLRSDDRMELVVNAVLADQVRPLWIQIRPSHGAPRTILLPPESLCELEGITIEPVGP